MTTVSMYKLLAKAKQHIVAIIIFSFFTFYVIHHVITRDSFEKDHASTQTATDIKFSSELQKIRLRPSDRLVVVPANHLWFVHKDRIHSASGTQDIPYVGKMWNRVEVMFLLPNFDVRNKANENFFSEDDGQDLIEITIFKARPLSGDVRKAWSERAVFVKRHTDFKLNEYQWKHKWFRSDSGIVIGCWEAVPEVFDFSYMCTSTYSPLDGINVNYAFHMDKISEWERIDSFVRKTVKGYLDAGHIASES